jgi:DNA-binding response OmpR family regulator
METHEEEQLIRVLIADDDEHVLDCYRDAFTEDEPTNHMKALDALAAELFDPATDIVDEPKFDVVSCSQGDDAISLAQEAAEEGSPFDVVILDVRMPPGIDGVEAGSQIRAMDSEVQIIFVSGFSDVPLEELQRRVPPPIKLHYFNKPLSFTQLAHDVASMVRTH